MQTVVVEKARQSWRGVLRLFTTLWTETFLELTF